MSEQIGEAKYKDSKNKNLKIEKIAYDAEAQKLFVNDSLHFCGVSEAVWEYKIGGYQVLDKYLKSHKGEEIDYKHFSNIIKTLHKSLEIESCIANIKLV
ncbi:type ISP restriction/modification enzyme [uncultured Helicobacter sp.]|uniref:type ISP restriction/modification enzyme n=1 Tax=uncultured Helicobacter sp. TaxID=175537 RepID=UPI0026237CDD|nr:type ISP restriction/modification enzyme [uncultured Helicobacter sp.]